MGHYPEGANPEFDQHRILFCIRHGILHIDKQHTPRSHLEWYRAEGWITDDNDSAMERYTRGTVEGDRNDIYFYRGYNFEVDDQAQKDFFTHLFDLQRRLNLPPSAEIFGGKIPTDSPGRWEPRRSYGPIGKNL